MSVTAEAREDDLDYAAMAEDIEIMQRIINDALRERFQPTVYAGDGRTAELLLPDVIPEFQLINRLGRKKTRIDKADAATLYKLSRPSIDTGTWVTAWSTDFDIRGFYIPGSGVVYTLEFPVRAGEFEAVEQRADAKEDDWARAEREVRGGGAGTTWKVRTAKSRKRCTIDRDDLNATIRTLLEAVGKYGARIEHLGADEAIIIAAEVTGRSGIPAAAQVVFFPDVIPLIEIDMAKHRVIIEVPVGAIKDYDSGLIDLDTLEKRAKVTTYRSHSSGSSWGSWGSGM
jgi:hypothetical protein